MVTLNLRKKEIELIFGERGKELENENFSELSVLIGVIFLGHKFQVFF